MDSIERYCFQLAKKFGTPYYCYDAAVIEQSINSIRQSLSQNISIYYSMKANPNISLCSIVNNHHIGVEVCSLSELNAALQAKFISKKIIVVGPAKSSEFLKKAISIDVGLIVCESLREFKLIDAIAASKNKRVKVLLRINPKFSIKTAPLKMGGVPSQFGIDEEVIINSRQEFQSTRNINVSGIHVYNASGVLDQDDIVSNIDNILRMSISVSRELDINLQCVDIGGGIGVSQDDSESIDIKSLGKKINATIQRYPEFDDISIIMELGRYIMAAAGIFVCKVVDIKSSRGKNFIISDGGINNYLGGFGLSKYLARQPIIQLLKQENPKGYGKKYYDIVGPLCTPQDIHAKNCLLEEASIDDLLVIYNAGAYGFTASPQQFLSHGVPSELLVHGDEVYCIRNAMSADKEFKNQILIKEIGCDYEKA